MPTIHINIDDTSYATADDDQTAAALLRLAGHDPKYFDLFRIRHGVEDRIHDAQIVDLADGQHFRARRKLHFSIDGEQHTTYDEDQTAGDLLRLAQVDPAGYDLSRVSDTPETFSAGQIVTIHNEDQFVTAKRVGGVA
ncbi:hypothetical protein [uncultured Friedmanniella sp.]|uniref:hypothetical protein n=1 Tax=uncultured Friedmanniella sp. TaxID=335381 RepID=UPI0035C97097